MLLITLMISTIMPMPHAVCLHLCNYQVCTSDAACHASSANGASSHICQRTATFARDMHACESSEEKGDEEDGHEEDEEAEG